MPYGTIRSNVCAIINEEKEKAASKYRNKFHYGALGCILVYYARLACKVYIVLYMPIYGASTIVKIYYRNLS